MKYITNLDLNRNELQNAVIQPLLSAPANPNVGQIYYNSTDKALYQYDGTSWKEVGSSNAVKYVEQELTSEQQAQARSNIGAGTSSFSGDYGDLSNKPTIPTKTSDLNNDSGFITSGQAPVQSVNGSTGNVSITATGLGAYVKPSGGIPSTDMSASVQSSLALANTALQSAPVTNVTINDVSVLDGTVAKIIYATGLGSDSNNAATVTAIRAFVNSSIESVAAYYITSNAQGDAFETKANLDAGGWYYAGHPRTPTRNDYAIVISDETHSNQTARYVYTENQWAFQYTFNMGFTQAQIDALNSGITSAKVALYDAHLSNTSNPHSVTKAQVGLGDVGNFKAVSTVAGQGLTDTEKSNARTNIGAGTSSFSGDYNDLSNKPTIPTITLNGNASTTPSFYAPASGGTAGQVLTSNGNNAPTWQPAPESIHKYSANNVTLTASGGAWTWTITASTHGISNPAMYVALYEISTGSQVIADVVVNQSNYSATITIVDSASIGTLEANTYKVVLIG